LLKEFKNKVIIDVILEKMDLDMNVTKRNGELEPISFDKILNRIRVIGHEVDIHINYTELVMKVIDQLYDKIDTSKIDELLGEQCASLSTNHTDYAILASRISISNYHKNTASKFSDAMETLYNYVDKENGNSPSPIVSHTLWDFVKENRELVDSWIDHSRDYLLDYFGFKTLEKNYLLKANGVPVERVQHMWMRVSIGIHGTDLGAIKETYDLMSQKYFTHATPTLFNSGTPHSQLSSCFLIAMEEDSINGIFNTLKECAKISKFSGGIGLHIHNIRPKKSRINGTNGLSDGIVPMLKVYNATAKYVNQGGKRNGSFAIYLEPWHPDMEDFLELKKNHGDEEMKSRDLFYAVWICDLFMARVQANQQWSFFCPNECPGLADVYGEEFTRLYESYESAGKARRVMPARELWYKILDAQMETGTPYLLYKDAVNKKSNQKNLGTIKSSNLCCEVTLYTDSNETAVCNLASIALPTFVNPVTKEFDYEMLEMVVKVVTNNLNRVIDVNYYPTEKARNSNLKHRPIGIGVQGLADAFILMDIPFHSEKAKDMNKLIFETIYYASLVKSNELARVHGSYSSFEGSPASQGILQFDMWDVKPVENRYDWDALKDSIKKDGLRNSMLISPMPTASTSQILGFNECFEPLTSNIYTRRTLAGEFVIVNKYLMKELIDMGLWNDKIKNNIIVNKGSIQQLDILPQHIRDKYKIVWEIPMKHVIDMSADRGVYICQSQSLNLWLEEPTYSTLTSMHFYSWKKGLKTGCYYLRRKAKHQPQQFTIEPEMRESSSVIEEEEICEMCSA
jgi:ribonucleoside-diphosphate reductase alpha chain